MADTVWVQLSKELAELLGDWSPPVQIKVTNHGRGLPHYVLESRWAETGLPGECDWGGCDQPAVAWRSDEIGAQWLPVCAGHIQPGVAERLRAGEFNPAGEDRHA